MATTVVKNIFDLKPHNDNVSIYGDNEDISDIKSSILLDGLKEPLTVSDSNIIISGHRRWTACKELVNEGHEEFTTVECYIKHYDNETEILSDIITFNVQRVKSMETIAREVLTFKNLYSIKAQKRKTMGKKSDIVTNLGQGRTIDIVAEKFTSMGYKLSRNNVTVLVQAIEFIDDKSNQKIDIDVISTN